MISILGRDKKHIDDIFIKACEDGKLELIELLFINAIDPLIYYDTAFIGACSSGHLSVVDRLLQNGFVVSEDAFIGACSSGHLSVVDRLLQNGFVVSKNAFISACIIRFFRVCQYLQNGLIENRIVQLLLQNEHIVRALQDLHINIVGLLHT